MPCLTWIDHDAEARERSLRILALFQEPGKPRRTGSGRGERTSLLPAYRDDYRSLSRLHVAFQMKDLLPGSQHRFAFGDRHG